MGFDPDITQGEMEALFRNAGLHLHIVNGLHLVVDRVPAIVRKDPPLTNVLRLPARARKAQ